MPGYSSFPFFFLQKNFGAEMIQERKSTENGEGLPAELLALKQPLWQTEHKQSEYKAQQCLLDAHKHMTCTCCVRQRVV